MQKTQNLKLNIPPKPPIVLTPQVACNPDTPATILWHIAENVPALRKWVIANPSADAHMLEYISQKGGPDVRHSLEVLFAAYDYAKSNS